MFKDVDRENTHLVTENQKLLAELDAGRKREAELIEHLVSAQMRVDKLQAVSSKLFIFEVTNSVRNYSRK